MRRPDLHPFCPGPGSPGIPHPSSPIPMFSALRPILNKGGAGHYATRAQSAERLLPIADRHLCLF